jgi:hypothetical protein
MPFSRGGATNIIAESRRIVNPRGVERLEKVRIGGIDQWVTGHSEVIHLAVLRATRTRCVFGKRA